jgi:hypothetical protein
MESEIEKDLYRLLQLKAQKAEIEHEIEDIQRYVSTLFDQVEFRADNRVFKAKVVRSETSDVDLAALKANDIDLYNRVTKKVLDKTAFNRIVTNGELEAELAQQIIIIKDRKAWVSINEVKEQSEDSNE